MANQRDPLSGIAYMKRVTREGDKVPFQEGFIGISKEMLEVLLEQDTDDYGCVKIEIALWTQEQKGVLKGTAKLPYSIRKQMNESRPASTPRQSPVSKKVKSYEPAEEDDTEF